MINNRKILNYLRDKYSKFIDLTEFYKFVATKDTREEIYILIDDRQAKLIETPPKDLHSSEIALREKAKFYHGHYGDLETSKIQDIKNELDFWSYQKLTEEKNIKFFELLESVRIYNEEDDADD